MVRFLQPWGPLGCEGVDGRGHCCSVGGGSHLMPSGPPCCAVTISVSATSKATSSLPPVESRAQRPAESLFSPGRGAQTQFGECSPTCD